MRNDITIDFLSIIDEGVAVDTEVEMTKCVAMKSPHYHGRLHVAVYHLKSTCPSVDEQIDAVAYFQRSRMQFLN